MATELEKYKDCYEMWAEERRIQLSEDAKDAITANMPGYADITFLSSLKLAGIKAAKRILEVE